MNSDFYLKCEGISKSYPILNTFSDDGKSIISNSRFRNGRYIALDDINFQLNLGDRLGIIGDNGAGKSTLLKIIGGIIKPSSGQIVHRGKTSAVLEASNLLYRDLTGIENIYIVGQLLGIKKSQIRQSIEDIINYSEIGAFKNKEVRLYSSGMKLRLAMSIYRFLNPDILLLDEVLTVGDIGFREKLSNTFKNIFSHVPIMVLVSHEMQAVFKLCNKCIYIKDGKLQYFGKTEDIYEKYSLEHLGKRVDSQYESMSSVTILNEARITKTFSESVQLSFRFHLKESLPEFRSVFYINSELGTVLTDSLLYRAKGTPEMQAGEYIIRVNLPSCLLNIGKFYASCIIEVASNILLNQFSLAEIEVVPDDWEVYEPWNISPKYPIRPRLDWGIEKV